MPSSNDVVEQYTPFGYFSSGGGEGGYTPVAKRAILQYFARTYGTSSPEYLSAAKRWPKQANKVEKQYANTPAGVSSPVIPGQQPLVYQVPYGGRLTGVAYTSAVPNFNAAKVFEEVTKGGELALGLSGFGSLRAIKSFADLKGYLRALFAARDTLAPSLESAKTAINSALEGYGVKASETIQEFLKRPKILRDLEIQAKARAEKLFRWSQLNAGPKDAKGASRVGPIATKVAARIKAGAKSPTGQAITGGAVAGAVSAIVSKALNPEAPKPRRTKQQPPGASPGAGTSSRKPLTRAEAKVQARKIVEQIKAGSPKPDPAHGVGPGGAAGQRTDPVAEAGRRAAQRAIGASSSIPVPKWLATLQSIAGDYRPIRSVGRTDQLSFPMIGPQTQTQGLTGFTSGGVGYSGCECAPKRPRKPRKPRNVCYSGRFYETARGTTKYEKRKRSTCQPFRKKPQSQRAR